jgi:hypothetical protein
VHAHPLPAYYHHVKVAVSAPAERADTLPLFNIYSVVQTVPNLYHLPSPSWIERITISAGQRSSESKFLHIKKNQRGLKDTGRICICTLYLLYFQGRLGLHEVHRVKLFYCHTCMVLHKIPNIPTFFHQLIYVQRQIVITWEPFSDENL